MGRRALHDSWLNPHAREALAELGDQIRIARIDHGLTKAELAARCAISPRTLTSIEAGRPEPSIGRVLTVAAVLGIHLFDGPEQLRRQRPHTARIARLIPQRATSTTVDDDF